METNSFSLWGATAVKELDTDIPDIYTKEFEDFIFRLRIAAGALWITVQKSNQTLVNFRTAFSPSSDLKLKKIRKKDEGVDISLNAAIGEYKVLIDFYKEEDYLQLHYQVKLKASRSLNVPFWPNDILFPKIRQGDTAEVYVRQIGARSGLVYLGVKKPHKTGIFYFQNLSAINEYFKDTKTSASSTVSSDWPEMGFALPSGKQPIQAKKEYIVSEAFVSFKDYLPKNQFDIAEYFISQLAKIYLQLPKPETGYQAYTTIVSKNLRDLQHNKGCWSYSEGKPYLNAYLCDYATPPEIMVQLAVLTPLMDYNEWTRDGDMEILKHLLDGLPAFYSDKIKCIVRWLPAKQDQLDGEEEHKVPEIIDSWYLYHPLLNLSRLALKGVESAKKLFMDSLDYVIKGAHHFKYRWPVFYNIETFEVIKEETTPGKGGEKDVAGLYAHVMLQAYELTGEKKYLSEAEKAANTLTEYGFDLFYQANNTSFSAGAMYRLWKETGNKLYRDLSNLFLANLFKNMGIWECGYGNGEYFPTFFSLFPLNDAPYLAVYEEQEAVAAIQAYLLMAEEDVLPDFSLLLAEFIRYAQNRLPYYYPTMLPKEMLSDEVKTGELDSELWIPLEDIQDGWEKSGSVGQEVYGAGLTFGVIPRQYVKSMEQEIMVYVDYPFIKLKAKEKRNIHLKILGSEKLHCLLRIELFKLDELPAGIKLEASAEGDVPAKKSTKKYREYTLRGNQEVNINW